MVEFKTITILRTKTRGCMKKWKKFKHEDLTVSSIKLRPHLICKQPTLLIVLMMNKPQYLYRQCDKETSLYPDSQSNLIFCKIFQLLLYKHKD